MYNPNEIFQDQLPVIAVRGIVFLPVSDIRVEIGRAFTKQAIQQSEDFRDGHVLLVFQENPKIENPEFGDFLPVGIVAKIAVKIKLPNGNFRIKFTPITRVKLNELVTIEPFYEIDFTSLLPARDDFEEQQVLIKMLSKEITENVKFLFRDQKKVMTALKEGITASNLSDLVASEMRITESERVKYLSELSTNKRIQLLLEDIEKQKRLQAIENRINENVQKSSNQTQKEYILRQKMRAIQEELGDSKQSDAEKFLKDINEANMPDKVKEKALKELKRYEYLAPNSNESNVSRTYIETLISIPWSKETEDEKDINIAIKKLESSHYGLEKVKDRIIEYLSVKMLTGKNPQTILCLAGPPGVGKTSLAKSIANALNRQFVKTSLGGVHDEAEIRGHRRTYVGALPGRVINGMIKAGVTNPVFLIDEIDKLAQSHKDDPSSALLEVLDPEQNKFFSDHYVEEDYDLSKVMFITTANYLQNIPAPLRDRMEVIDVSSYTEIEKFHIAKRFLINKQIKAHGLEEGKLTFSDSAVKTMIREYTREAGVRQLERLIGTVVRKAIKEILIKKKDSVNVNQNNIYKFLGKSLYTNNKIPAANMIGVVTGLAYTMAGGDTLEVETSYYPGKNNLVLTGNLGDVMKESAMAALSFVKANQEKLNIDADMIANNDFHIHVPEGAIPKDGPSAGVTIATALISAMSHRKVNRFVGMTGEITLNGRVLPIGGLKEKAIAASRSGLKEIVIPDGNEKDVEDIPKEVRDVLTIHFAKKLDDVLKIALVD